MLSAHPPKTLIVERKEKVAGADSAVASHTSAGFELADLMFEGLTGVEHCVGDHGGESGGGEDDKRQGKCCRYNRCTCLRMSEGMWLLLCSGCRGHCFCFVEYFE